MTITSPYRMFSFTSAREIPKSRLKIGPARLPVSAMTPKPRRASATFKAKSGAEFPIARSVIARYALGILSIIPNVLSTLTRTVAANQIQIMLIMKVSNAIITWQLGIEDFLVNAPKAMVPPSIAEAVIRLISQPLKKNQSAKLNRLTVGNIE